MFERVQGTVQAGSPLATLQRIRTVGSGSLLDSLSVGADSETLVWGANLAPSGLFATHVVTATTGAATAIAAPTILTPGNRHLFIIANASGGAMGAVTWNAAYLFNQAFTPPVTGTAVAIEFEVLANGTQLRQVGAQSGGGSPSGQAVVTPAWVPAGVTINNALGRVFNVVAATAVPFTLLDPSVDVPAETVRIRVENASGGVAGGITFGAGYSLMGPPIGEIPDGYALLLQFTNIGGGVWLEGPRTYVDVRGLHVTVSAVVANAAILTLPTTPVVGVVPSPGPGLIIQPVSWRIVSAITGNTTNINAAAVLALITSAGGDVPLSGFSEGDSHVSRLLATVGNRNGSAGAGGTGTDSLNDYEGQGLDLIADNAGAGDFTGGDPANELRTRVAYYVDEA